jgi:hypothetical protein
MAYVAGPQPAEPALQPWAVLPAPAAGYPAPTSSAAPGGPLYASLGAGSAAGFDGRYSAVTPGSLQSLPSRAAGFDGRYSTRVVLQQGADGLFFPVMADQAGPQYRI